MVCVFASCSDGGSEDPVNPTPKPEEVKTEITIDSSIISNGLSFDTATGEQSVSFSVNANWTLSIASTTSGATWCKASATSGSKGSATVKFSVDENTDYEDRSVSVTIKAGTVSKTFTITQKGADALLVTAAKYEVAQEGGQIEVEVKANIDYQLEISETAKDWITETKSKSRSLTTYKHQFEVALNEDTEKREGEIVFKSGDKVETVTVYQAGGAIILLSQNEYTVSDAGETISVDIKSNVEYGVQMPDVDWISDESSSRGMSSHTLKYVIAANDGYGSRSAEIIFYDKNSDLKDTLRVIQAQKDAIVISQKTYDVKAEGETIEVKLSTNVDFEVTMPDVDWITQTESRSLTEHILYFKVAENENEKERTAAIIFISKDSQLNDTITIYQKGTVNEGYRNGIVTIATPGSLKRLLGDEVLSISSLKILGPINGDDLYILRLMLGATEGLDRDDPLNENNNAIKYKLTTLDLSEATIVQGGEYYYGQGWMLLASDNNIGDTMFKGCLNMQEIVLPNNLVKISNNAFWDCSSLTSVAIPNGVTEIGEWAFLGCSSLTSVVIPDGITIIEDLTFAGCTSLNTIIFGTGVIEIDDHAFSGCSSLTSLIIPETVTEIGSKAFANCSSLTSVVIPKGVTHIWTQAFMECSSLTSIVIPESVNVVGEWAFGKCTSLVEVTILSGSIYRGAFTGCSSLTSVIMGSGVTSIGENAFYDCSLLNSVVISEATTSIGNNAFSGCISLTNVIIPNAVSEIGVGAFSGCSSLNSIIIGEGVSLINEYAFKDTLIKDYYCYANIPPTINDNTFAKSNSDATLHVPVGYSEAYKESDWANYFENIIEME